MGTTLTPPLVDGRHARWWIGLDAQTRRFLLGRRADELPVDVWRACLSAAVTAGTVEEDGWVGDLPAHHLPPSVAGYVDGLRTKRPRPAGR